MKLAVQQLFALLLLSACALGSRRNPHQALVVENRDSKLGAVHEGADGSAARGKVGGKGKTQGAGVLGAATGSAVKGVSAGKGSASHRLNASAGSLDSDSESFLGKDMTIRHLLQLGHDMLDINEAVSRLEGKLPSEVSTLVHLATAKVRSADGGALRADLNEDSLQKARKILNGMIEGAFKDLDAVLIECKEFKERNRGTHTQVSTDLARLGSQIADLERKKLKASEGIATQDRLHQEVTEQLEQVTQDYNTERAKNQADMTIRRNDMAVFDFILSMVRCTEEDAPAAALLLQGNASALPGAAAHHRQQQRGPLGPPYRVCSTGGGLELRFSDARLQAKLQRLLTPDARAALREVLGTVQARSPAGTALRLLQEEPAKETLVADPRQVQAPADPVVEAPAEGQWKKCTDGKPNCGLLHDTMSLQWGKFKDLVDEMQALMDKNHDTFKAEESNLNEQLKVIGDQKTQHMESLAESTSNLNMDNQERTDKEVQQRELQASYDKKMRQCREQVEEITFTNICAVRKVRNAICEHSATSPPSNITDCDVKDWVAGECSVDCDDACPMPDPYACGGEQTLTREIIVTANEFGVKCPVLTMTKKCNQFKCPVDCELSEWSGWSKCTKDCESGLQGKSRSILTKPKNGGQFCDTVQEERVCNTESCDRDCSLVEWSDWSPCSMACGTGFRERVREVSVPIRGFGKCPEKHHPDRLEEEDCNTQACVGDELCIAKQDLIILLDASGSLKQEGFEVLQSFAANLTNKYLPVYYGEPAMRVGIVLYGNGIQQPDGTIAPAINVIGLTDDMDKVHEAILATEWQRGFTNLAQALVLAGTMFQEGRSDAQSAILVLSDGKYSFEFETAQKVKELKDKSVQLFMAPVSEFGGSPEVAVMKTWASFPWETNFERIPGFAALKYNPDSFASRLVAKFCSKALSPSADMQRDLTRGFMLAHEGGLPTWKCGPRRRVGKKRTIDDCAATAAARGRTAFSYGREIKDKLCFMEEMKVEATWFDDHLKNRTAPPCPGGEWINNPYFDTYILEPPAAAF